MHYLETSFSKGFQQFQIVSKTVRVQASESLFLKCSLQFQIVSNTIKIHTLETLPLVAIHHVLLIWSFC